MSLRRPEAGRGTEGGSRLAAGHQAADTGGGRERAATTRALQPVLLHRFGIATTPEKRLRNDRAGVPAAAALPHPDGKRGPQLSSGDAVSGKLASAHKEKGRKNEEKKAAKSGKERYVPVLPWHKRRRTSLWPPVHRHVWISWSSSARRRTPCRVTPLQCQCLQGGSQSRCPAGERGRRD